MSRRLKPYSLRTRLLVIASLLMLVFFSLTAWVLDSAFSQSSESSTREKLQLYIISLLSSAEQSGEYLFIPEQQQEARFNQPSSGLYAYVLDQRGQELWRSGSALDVSPVTAIPQPPGERHFGLDNTHADTTYFVASYGVVWDSEGQDYQYTFVVMEDRVGYQAGIQSFRSTLWIWLGSVAVILLVAQHILLSRGLHPLQHLAGELRKMEAGDILALAGHYPKELSGLTDNLNRLVQSERKQRERYRQRLGDLAHSLKTPLAVLQNAANQPGGEQNISQLVTEQSQRMDQIVRYQLQRAVISQQITGVVRIPLLEHVNQVKQALDKVYQAKAVRCEILVDEELRFQGDQGDLMELLGNLIDNAYKYGAGEVRISASESADALTIVVEDNGGGIPEAQQQSIHQRGTRLDSQEQGQGIGLAVVSDIVSGYKGQLVIDDSDLLGARFTLIFPRQRTA